MQQRGFTLVELLTVIAVLAILIAILFPVFGRAREKARLSVCASNMRQIGAALTMYRQDHDELQPESSPDTTAALDSCQTTYTWRVSILPYVHNNQVFVCPTAPNLNGFVKDRISGPLKPKADYCSTGGYACLETYSFSGLGPFPTYRTPRISDAKVQDVSGTIQIVDSAALLNQYDKGPEIFWPDVMSQPHDTKWISNRHGNGLNCLFWDNHVKWLPRDAVGARRKDTGVFWRLTITYDTP